MKKRKNDPLLNNLPPLKKVEGKLPKLFDTLFDVKCAKDIDRYQLKDNITVQRLLA